MDKIRDLIAQALAGYLKNRPTKKKSSKKKASPVEEKKTEGISVNQTVHVGSPEPMNAADMALSRLQRKTHMSLGEP